MSVSIQYSVSANYTETAFVDMPTLLNTVKDDLVAEGWAMDTSAMTFTPPGGAQWSVTAGSGNYAGWWLLNCPANLYNGAALYYRAFTFAAGDTIAVYYGKMHMLFTSLNTQYWFGVFGGTKFPSAGYVWTGGAVSRGDTTSPTPNTYGGFSGGTGYFLSSGVVYRAAILAVQAVGNSSFHGNQTVTAAGDIPGAPVYLLDAEARRLKGRMYNLASTMETQQTGAMSVAPGGKINLPISEAEFGTFQVPYTLGNDTATNNQFPSILIRVPYEPDIA